MARVLYDGLVEYEDGTPATSSQMAKDVVEFLNWSAEPEMDQRKKMGVATIMVTSVLLALSIWVKRYISTASLNLKIYTLTSVLPDTNGPPSRQERLSTTLPWAVIPIHGDIREGILLAFAWLQIIDAKIVQLKCKYPFLCNNFLLISSLRVLDLKVDFPHSLSFPLLLLPILLLQNSRLLFNVP